MSALRDTAIYALGVLLARAAPVVTIPLLAHGLPAADYGRLETLVMIAELGGLLAGGGLSASVFRWAVLGDAAARRRAGAEALGAATGLALVTALLGVLLLPMASALLPTPASTTELQLIAVSFAIAAAVETPLALMRAEGRALRFTLLTVARLGLQIVLMAAFLHEGYGVTGALAAGALASTALALALMADLVPRIGWRLPGRTALSQHALYGGPLMLAGLAGFAQAAGDRWIVGEAFGPVELALYALAVKAAAFTALAVRPYDMWWEANRMRLRDGPDGRRRVLKAQIVGIALGAAAALVMASLGPWALRLATPEAYHGAADLLPLAAAVGALNVVAAYAGAGVYFRRTGFALLWANVAAAAAALWLYAVAIPLWGLEGALAARGVSYVLRATLYVAISALGDHGPRVPAAHQAEAQGARCVGEAASRALCSSS